MAGRYRYFDPRALTRIGRAALVARGVVEGFITGVHRSPFKGFSIEFAEHREYAPGDPLKHIDWRVWGRTDRLYVKQFEDETNCRCYLLLDRSASMGFRGGGTLPKFEYACFLAASLAYLAIRQQDLVGLVTFDHRVRDFLPPGSSGEHLRRILERLEAIRAGEISGMSKTFHDLAEAVKRRSFVIIISDLYDDEAEVMKAIGHFRHRKHEVLLFHLLDPAETEFPYTRLTDFVDMETGERLQVDPRYARGEYLAQLEAFCARMGRSCAEAGAEYARIVTGTPFDAALAMYLARRAKT
ncbi:MAG: DUF58 domain-containing protein [Planctomycetota bacterium]|nr:DUF58 domain-containing protein [Planctomycetota bacterium]